ncbi:MAG: pyruvate synthase subunit beta [Candidatus Aenigmarchaeota archaeon]|nr:pyruvate synthase subunit beta [Candidatus Aenigmarchaeota archaeon]
MVAHGSQEKKLFAGGSPLCAGCMASLGLKLALQALGKNTIVVNTSGCLTLLSVYPNSPMRVPWIHVAIENGGAVASGIYAAYKQIGKHVNILVYAGDGATYDIGLQSLSGAVERGDDFIYVCYNNQSFSNTGVQQSSATPFGASTKTTPPGKNNPMGNLFKQKSMAKIMAAHEIPYVATATVAFPYDYMQKLKKASAIHGPKFIDLLTPCPTGWGFDPGKGIEIGKLAVQTGMWPLFEVERGKFRLTHMPNKLRPVKDYLLRQKRFKHLKEKQINRIQEIVKDKWKKLLEGKFFEV